MKHEYTWSHIHLFAKICAKVDDEDSVTASWVQMTEEHHKQTFPFTIWPLTYRTCEVTTSPAMCSPIHIASTDSVCDYRVKIIRCNEIVIICVQEGSCGNTCDHACMADLDNVVDEDVDDGGEDLFSNHSDHHCVSKNESLLPCHAAHCYHQIKTGIKDAFFAIQDDVQSVIVVGHGAGAMMASCLAHDLSQTYEAERKFLGLETKRVDVDFVGFSDFVVASPAYWDKCSIDSYISIALEGCVSPAKAPGGMIRNPSSFRVIVDTSPSPNKSLSMSRSMSVLGKIKRGNNKNVTKKSKDYDRNVSEYVSALHRKITLPLTSNA